MGATQSDVKRIDPRKEQLRRLGNKYPFGDPELTKLIRTHRNLQFSRGSSDTTANNDFILELAVHSLHSDCDTAHIANNEANPDVKLRDTKQDARERKKVIQFIEERILPAKFGYALETAAFVCNNQITQRTIPETISDPFGEDEHLDKFLDGVSRSGRKGGRAALEIMFDACVLIKSEKIVNNQPRSVGSSDLIDLGYRLSIASFLLSSEEKLRTEENDAGSSFWESFVPCTSKSSLSSLESLSKSLQEAEEEMANQQQPTFYASASSDTIASKKQPLQKHQVSLDAVILWAERTAPLFSATLSTFMHYLLFPDKPYPPSRTPFLFPELGEHGSAIFGRGLSSQLFSFACMSRSLGGMWYRLYSSDHDGMSFNRLSNALLGYSGPTLVIIREQGGGTFGAFTSSTWKESADFYGNNDCFLFQLEPYTTVMRPRMGGSNNFMYCNPEARSKGYDKLPHGIGFGGTRTDKPRLFISEDFDTCFATSGDLTFVAGALLPPTKDGFARKHFEVDSIETWGVGGNEVVEAALGDRVKQRKIFESNIRKARLVDKAQFLDDFKSGLIESKAFVHRGQIDGRAHNDDKET